MERKILKKKILGIFCTLCLCICMTSSSTVVYGAGVDSCVDRIEEGRYANISMYHTNLEKWLYFYGVCQCICKGKGIHINYHDIAETVRHKLVRCNKLV